MPPRPLKRQPIFGRAVIGIPLTKGLWAFIDLVDADLAAFNWTAEEGPRTAYAYRRGPKPRQEVIRLHQVIAARKGVIGPEVDHEDGNGLNNRRTNLRGANSSQQKCNTHLRIDNRSGHRGVSWSARIKRWVATISFEGRRSWLGCFHSKHRAVRVYRSAARRLHGQFRRTA